MKINARNDENLSVVEGHYCNCALCQPFWGNILVFQEKMTRECHIFIVVPPFGRFGTNAHL
jgi:hypothetical protein